MKPVFTHTYNRFGTDIRVRVYEPIDGSKPVLVADSQEPQLVAKHREALAKEFSQRYGGPKNVSWWEQASNGELHQTEFTERVHIERPHIEDIGSHEYERAVKAGQLKPVTTTVLEQAHRNISPAESETRIGSVPQTHDQEVSMNQSAGLPKGPSVD